MNIDRVNSEMRKELSALITNGIKDERLSNYMISVMRVETTKDLKFSNVFVSIMGENKKEALAILNNSANFLRSGLFQRLRIRAVPAMTFYLDDSVEYGFKINKILKDLNIKEEEESE